MMLTETEIYTALDSVSACVQDRDIVYSRSIEAAVLAKLREIEPVCVVSEHGIIQNVTDRPLEPLLKLYLHPAPSASDWIDLSKFQPLETVEYWYRAANEDPYGIGGGMVTTLLHEYAVLRAMLSAARSE